MESYILLETGDILAGRSFGSNNSANGEVVFQTGMVGYPESLTDPSYSGQILVLTYPIIGSYGVPSDEVDEYGIKKFMESNKIHISGLVVGEYIDTPSHWQSIKTLGEWLNEYNIPGIYDIDTRHLTKLIRQNGTLLGTIIRGPIKSTDWNNIKKNSINLVKTVSRSDIVTYNSKGFPHILVVDCGIKNNQLRSFLNLGCKVTVVPFDYDFTKLEFDRIFISNGPGDPTDCDILINRLRLFMENNTKEIPIFGICLGHQILALAAGCKTYKMKYGNRGHNIPCYLVGTKRCYITSQNHGYAVNDDTIPTDWEQMFINANDGSNEGIKHRTKPYYSVQFHPEAKGGPNDTWFMIDLFVKNEMYKLWYHSTQYKPNPSIRRKVLILGSGGLSIGQSGEFDYSGSQAIKAFNEEGLTTILINPNIATVQTSPGFANKVYFLAVDSNNVKKVIKQERPDCIALSFGGQTALNCGIDLWQKGILKKYNIEIIGTPIESIIDTEDRQKFADRLASIGESVPIGGTVTNVNDAINMAKNIGYPVLVRAAFALGGLGSGFANNEDELVALTNNALVYSDQITIDKSLRGWKEIEYEIVRDAYDNCIAVCNMENIDPLGIHTGESIVVAPSQTLTDHEYNMLRSVGIKIIKMLKIVGECNIQYALNPESNEYYVIEVNARLSRSSALASKATGYPLAYIAAKLGLGFSLLELKNSITKSTSACFEPSLDYCVVKIPRWDLQKFPMVSTKIDSAMKSIGESMAISRSFEEAFQKALRMSNESYNGFEPGIVEYSEELLREPNYNRMFSLASAIYDNKYTIDELYKITKIDKWFLNKFKKIIDLQKNMENTVNLNFALLKKAKRLGFNDKLIAKCIKSTEIIVRNMRYDYKLLPKVKQIDTVSGEFPCMTNYLYLTYNANNNDISFTNHQDNRDIMVLGSGVYKIGSSVEFDWCTVNCIKQLRESKFKTIVVNCNPETVSTDYDEADKLYFDELSFETVMDIYSIENPSGVILAMGGQQPNNIALSLYRHNVRVIGTSPEMIDMAENRYKFSRLLDQLMIDQPKWKKLTSVNDAKEFCAKVEYPCLVRPSYVLSGAAMNVAYSDKDLEQYLGTAVSVSKDHPVVISKFITDAKEIEVDAVSRNGKVKLIAISEHVENAGVHSGDATLLLPPQDITTETMSLIKDSVIKISKSLDINGPFNIQFIAKDNQIKVIECNLRVSRSFPFVSKTLGVNFAKEATKVMLGIDIKSELMKIPNMIGIKVPQFSFHRLKGADINLGVEMISTGEVACFGENKFEAFLKGIISTGFKLPKLGSNILLSIGSYRFKKEFVQSANILQELGYNIFGTFGTTDFYAEKGLNIVQLPFSSADENNQTIQNSLANRTIDLVINISTKNKMRSDGSNITNGYVIRRMAIENNIPIITDIKFAKLFVNSLKFYIENLNCKLPIRSGIDCFTSYKIVKLPGLIDIHVHIREPGNEYKEDWTSGTQAALAGGVTMICNMPNTDPPITTRESFDLICKIAKEKACCDYGIYVGASSQNTSTVCELANEAFGLKMYLNNTYGPLLLNNTLDWIEHIKNWPNNRPLCVHAESKTLAAILHVANLYKKKIHVCHVSTREEIELIKQSRLVGMKITCEVSPHHLFMSHEHHCIKDGCTDVKPPLASEDDKDALWENLKYIDCFATDHAPHTVDDKVKTGCPGFPGLETALPLLLTAVKQGRLTIDDIVEKYHHNPKKIFDLPDQPDTYIEVDLDKEWTIPENMKYSKCKWTPFANMKVYGSVCRVVLRGKVVYVDGEVLANPGYGINIRSCHSDTTNVGPSIESNVEPTKSLSITTLFDSKEFYEQTINDDDNNIDNDIQINNIISVEQFNRDLLRVIFKKASNMKQLVKKYGRLDILKDKVLASIFYEPSTRTRCSFTAAMKRLGGEVVEISADISSVQKGESLEDFLRSMECYSDIIVMRSSEEDSTDRALKVLNKPFINAGNGIGEHPTQALLDAFTIREERGSITDSTITLLGDLKHGRTVHSLAKLLSQYENVRFRYVSPKGLEMPEHIKKYISDRGIEQTDHYDINEVLETTDVLYVTRIQKERFKSEREYDALKGSYIIDHKVLSKAKSDLVVLHPLPRVDEISKEVDSDDRSAYFRQMENGMYVRMALLAMIFGR